MTRHDLAGEFADAITAERAQGRGMQTNSDNTKFTRTPAVQLRGVVKSFCTAGAVVPAVRGIDVPIAAGETRANNRLTRP
jgi:hypothetical protein